MIELKDLKRFKIFRVVNQMFFRLQRFKGLKCWGKSSIQMAFLKTNHKYSKLTIKKYLKNNGQKRFEKYWSKKYLKLKGEKLF
jgi:hypothetical protein